MIKKSEHKMTKTHEDVVLPFLSGSVIDFPSRRKMSLLERNKDSMIQFTLLSSNNVEQRVEVIDGESQTIGNRRIWEGTLVSAEAIDDDTSDEPETAVRIVVNGNTTPTYTILQ